MAERRRRRASHPLDRELDLDSSTLTPSDFLEAEDAEVEPVETLPAIPNRPEPRFAGPALAPFPNLSSPVPPAHEAVAEEPPAADPTPVPTSAESERLSQMWETAMADAELEPETYPLPAAAQHNDADDEIEEEPERQLFVHALEAHMKDAPFVPLRSTGDDADDPLAAALSSFASLEPGQVGLVSVDLKPARDYQARQGAWAAELTETGVEPKRLAGGSSLKLGLGGQRGAGVAWAVLKAFGVIVWFVLSKVVWGLVKALGRAATSGSRHSSAAPDKPGKARAEDERVVLGERDKDRLKIARERKRQSPFFEARIRVAVAEIAEAEDELRASAELSTKASSIADSFADFNTHDSFVDQELVWEECDGIDALVGLSPPRRSNDMLLSAPEAALLAHPPSVNPPGVVLDRSELRPLLPRRMPPLVHDRMRPPAGLIPIGSLDAGENAGRIVAVPNSELDKHAIVVGRSGSGKSEVANNLALGIARSGYPMVVIDPHGELAEQIMDTVLTHCPERIDDIVVVDPTDEWAPAINPLDVSSEDEISGAVGRVVTMMTRQAFDKNSAPRAYTVAKQVLRALCMANLHLPPEHKLSIAHVRRFMTNEEFRMVVMNFVSDPTIRESFGEPETSFYEKLKETQQQEWVAPIARVFDGIMESPAFRRMFVTTDKLDFSRLISERKIVLVKMAQGAGEEEQELSLAVAAMILPTVISSMAVLGRSRRNRNAVGCRIIIDEAPAIMSTLNGLEKLLAQARKFDAGVITVAQDMDQMGKLRQPLYTNASNKFCLALPRKSVLGFNDAFSVVDGVTISEEDIAALPNYAAYADFMIEGRAGASMTTGPFALHTLPPAPLNSHDQLEPLRERVIQNSRREVGVDPAEVAARLTGMRLFDGPFVALQQAFAADPTTGASRIKVAKEAVEADGMEAFFASLSPDTDDDFFDPSDLD